MFKPEWYEIVGAGPSVAQKVRAWDKAATDKKKGNDPAWTVGSLWSMTDDGVYYVEDVVRLRGGPRKVEDAIKNTATRDGTMVDVAIWQDPGQAGKSDIDTFVRLLKGYTVVGYPAREDKITYAKPVSSQAERGNVKVVRAGWNELWLEEHHNFPDAKEKDQVDSSSLALLHLVTRCSTPVGPGGSEMERRYHV
jgi:predicted phage terminase large subunit-like protein